MNSVPYSEGRRVCYAVIDSKEILQEDKEDLPKNNHVAIEKPFQRSRNDGYDKSKRNVFRCGVLPNSFHWRFSKPQKTRQKEHSLEEYGATMEKMRWKRLKMKLAL
ncbi:hypothetical protein Tco_0909080 [Tanacetum coccineum]|uniref:Uncharacterized protein n=1 Tax=Tanacetum coccineum TaxID=301880 RepID=A0ABQ5CP51_9ASTR